MMTCPPSSPLQRPGQHVTRASAHWPGGERQGVSEDEQ